MRPIPPMRPLIHPLSMPASLIYTQVWLFITLVSIAFLGSAFANPPTAKLVLNLSITCQDNSQCDQRTALVDQLRTDLTLTQLKVDEFPAQTNFLFERTEQEIRNSLRAQGFYHLTVTKQLERTPALTQITFDIVLGQPIVLRQIIIQISGDGKDLLEWQNYRQFELKLRRGEQLNHATYSRTLTDLRNIALNEGYLDAQFLKREFRVYPDEFAADVHIHLDTQQGYLFGDVRFSGHQRVPSSLLHRYVEIEPGTAYTQHAMTQLQRALIDSGYFGMVRINPQYTEEKHRLIPIDIELEDNQRQAYKVGAGFGTDTGARILLGFEDRLFNRQGHSYQLDSLIGERAQSFNANYRIPGHRPLRQQWNLGFNWDATQSDSLERQRTAISPSFLVKLDDTWQVNFFSSLEYEEFEYLGQSAETNQLLLVGSGIQKRWLNNEAYPTAGYRHNATFRLSAQNSLSESEFMQFELASRAVIAPLPFWRFIARSHIGFTLAHQDQVIPSTYRYLLGGENLRGYKFESIGIDSQDNQFIGGRNMFLVSLETDFRFSQFFGLGLFSDAGQVSTSGLPDQLKVGAGFGLRGFTPVGTAKLDMAWPISEAGYNQNWRIHFSIGLDL
ncbi:autotransporter assembly complex protein TamA [Thiomicrospira microaerophila]|uniref:autotransporter assembly complex protein TamA n=1 Tax=Thiomicrospira microaerophila TaxID=406020 RepID=UPI0018E07253|nr:BamA/TamA family outer membrane protein [Thiomicrospira microaerophila]